MKKTKLHIGCSSYYNSNWKPEFYPEGLPRKEWFDFYCQHFNTYEMNGTFYKPPTVKNLISWYDKSPEDFIFSVKAPKIITHLKKFNDSQKEIQEFYQTCEEGLKHKLGLVLFQLPPSFHYSDENLDLVLSNLNTEFQNIIEFRHLSWWNDEVLKIFKEKNITFCNVSHPTLPDSIAKTNSLGYFRFHGSPKMFYSSYENEYLEKILESIATKNFEEFYIYFNNTASIAGISNALEMKKLQSEI